MIRLRKRLCSKDDEALVQSTNFVPESISIEDQRDWHREPKTTRICYESRTVRIQEEGNGGTRVERLWSPGNTSHERGNRQQVARRIIERMCPNGRIAARRVAVLNFSVEPSAHWSVRCEEMRLRMLGQHRLNLWLSKTVANLKRLEMQEWEMDRGVADTPQVRNTRDFLRMSRDVTISDEQLARITAPSVVIISNSILTQTGAKQAFRKYVGKSKGDDEFEVRFSKENTEPDTFNHLELFDKKWTLKKFNIHEDIEGMFCYTITGGFENEHGVREFPYVAVFVFPTYVTLQARDMNH